MKVRKTTEPFNPESKLYQAESVVIDQDWLTAPDILRYFKGRQAFLFSNNYEASDLIQFLDRWKSGEAFQKLEYLQIDVVFEYIPKNQILNAIGAKYIDATKTPPTHSVPKV
ncbi:hypothetical protein B9Z55_010875 [Caenorhabditis nigoni]|nr:hypothetical protein B9Z55_010875 [Caenorhabditis nigoni]